MTATATFEEQTNQQVSAGEPVERAGEAAEHRPSRRERRAAARAARAVEQYRELAAKHAADTQTIDQFTAPPTRPGRTPAERFTLAVSLVAHGLLAVVVAAVAAASWHGLYGFAEHILSLDGAWRIVAPLSLDAAAMACAAIALRATIDGESAAMPRFLVLIFMAASCVANAYHSLAVGEPVPAAVYFGAMSVAAVLMFDLVLKQIRLRALRSAGRARKPLPSFGIRWMVSPFETAGAWVTAGQENVSTTDAAVARYREIKTERRTAKAARRAARRAAKTAGKADAPEPADKPSDEHGQADEQEPRPAPRKVVELHAMSVAEQIVAAWEAIGSYAIDGQKGAVAWLETNYGITVDRSYAFDVRRKQLDARMRDIWGMRGDYDEDAAIEALQADGLPIDRKYIRKLARKVEAAAVKEAANESDEHADQNGRQFSVVAGGGDA